MPKKLPAQKPVKVTNEKTAAAAIPAVVQKKQKKAVKPRKIPVKPEQIAEAVRPYIKSYYYATGKRKTAIAKIRLYPKGTGAITVNDRGFNNYFPANIQQQIVHAPLKVAGLDEKFDFTIQVKGGGPMSQAEAIRHGISKTLLAYNCELRLALKRAGYLTRDSRVKERKKYGLKRARRAPQFSKR